MSQKCAGDAVQVPENVPCSEGAVSRQVEFAVTRVVIYPGITRGVYPGSVPAFSSRSVAQLAC